MSFEDLLTKKRSSILSKWFDLVINTYPHDTALFLKNQKNQFRNPVGHTILEGLDTIFDELRKGIDHDAIAPFLDTIIRIRAVQDFSPSQALSFVSQLKTVVREETRGELNGTGGAEGLTAFEDRIDALMLLSFDIFMKCREKIYDLKANELRNMTFRMLERVNRKSGLHDTDNQDTTNDTLKRNEVDR